MDDEESKNYVAAEAIQKALSDIEWWNAVHKEVRQQIGLIVTNAYSLGLPFRDAFLAACELERNRRKLLKQNVKPNTPSTLFGLRLSEEKYQSGSEASKLLLGLGDWFEISEADVQACYLICEHINIVETLGVFDDSNDDVDY